MSPLIFFPGHAPQQHYKQFSLVPSPGPSISPDKLSFCQDPPSTQGTRQSPTSVRILCFEDIPRPYQHMAKYWSPRRGSYTWSWDPVCDLTCPS